MRNSLWGGMTIDDGLEATMKQASKPQTLGQSPLRVVLIDDHQFVLEGVKQRFVEALDLAVVAVANSVSSGIEVIRQELPDFAIVDYRLPDGDGIALIRQIRELSPSTKCVIYTSVAFEDNVRHGADAVVIKALFEDKLIETLRGLRDDPA